MPNSSKVTTLLRLPMAANLSFILVSSRERIPSMSRMILRSPRSRFISSMASPISSSCSCSTAFSVSAGRPIFLRDECPIITASQSPVMILENNRSRLSLPKSSGVAARMFDPGYRRVNSLRHCSVKWLGTTNRGLRDTPRRRISIASVAISKVLPAPTTWSYST